LSRVYGKRPVNGGGVGPEAAGLGSKLEGGESTEEKKKKRMRTHPGSEYALWELDPGKNQKGKELSQKKVDQDGQLQSSKPIRQPDSKTRETEEKRKARRHRRQATRVKEGGKPRRKGGVEKNGSSIFAFQRIRWWWVERKGFEAQERGVRVGGHGVACGDSLRLKRPKKGKIRGMYISIGRGETRRKKKGRKIQKEGERLPSWRQRVPGPIRVCGEACRGKGKLRCKSRRQIRGFLPASL